MTSQITHWTRAAAPTHASSLVSHAKSALAILGLLTLLTGVLYPLAITAIAQIVFPAEANGSFIVRSGAIVGSRLIGQPFDDPKYFWGRPSATSPHAYNGRASSGSNLGPTNPALTAAARARIDALRAADPTNIAAIPVDLVTASGSGLDPHITPAAALYQVERVARSRGFAVETVRALVDAHTERRVLGVLGEPVVNVLLLNLALDETK
ncbi:MAG: potassium-transporting ATPase subunit KdpC [Polyangiaceae bacterium]